MSTQQCGAVKFKLQKPKLYKMVQRILGVMGTWICGQDVADLFFSL